MPLSGSQCTIKCDIFSTNTDCKLDDFDLEAFTAPFQAVVHALEQKFDSIKDSRPSEEPESLPILKEHLKLERLAGMDVYPGRKKDNHSESFCRAEKGMLKPVS
jgi:hypothetical protein